MAVRPRIRDLLARLARSAAVVAAVWGAAALQVPVAIAAEEAPAGGETLHPVIASPASLTPERAEEIYQAIRGEMSAAYASSGDPLFDEYQIWKRYTRFPYRAGSHGERYANHLANDIAAAYERYEGAGPLPVGSIVIKDTFTVTSDGQVMTGPLFMMEKMPPGFASLAGSWRFQMLSADGASVGLTGGQDTAAVQFCGECHAKAGAEQDYLYFMPADARLK